MLTKQHYNNNTHITVGQDSRVGSKCILPGYGFGGPCFPRDNRALGNYAKSIGVNPIIPLATDESNIYHAKEMAKDFLAKNLDV
jgi:UDPglucose 6-dehydrogenase